MEGSVKLGHTWTDEERAEAAMMIWNKEKGTAAAVIIISWLAKVGSTPSSSMIADPFPDLLRRSHLFLCYSPPPWFLSLLSTVPADGHQHRPSV
jgi:hypothetical protein